MHDLFQRAEATSTRGVLCYVNADIILPQSLIDVVDRAARIKNDFLISGERWDLDVTELVDFSDPLWHRRLIDEVAARGKPLGKGGMDYFIYPKGFLREIPAFAIGRTAWDNWFLYYALKQRVPLIDASEMILAIHQNHDYAHAGGRSAAWKGPEATENVKLVGERIFNLEHSTHVMKLDGLHRTLSFRSIPYRLWDYIYLTGRLAFLKPVLWYGKRVLDRLTRRTR